MSADKMHVDEVPTDAGLVRRLVAAQFPQWADLSIERFPAAGTANAIYRLGDAMAVRLPRREAGADAIDDEQQWLPRLAPLLPLAVPVPLAKGEPEEGYPWHWSVHQWLEGESATTEPMADPLEAATALAAFIAALQAFDPTDGPPACGRGLSLSLRDTQVRSALRELRGMIDTDAAAAAWDAALGAPEWDRSLVWFHGDLQPGNLLVTQGRLSAVIDFGLCGVGDPACDVAVAWSVLPARARAAFRSALDVDDATWVRGRGWALFVGLVGLPYYLDTNPAFARFARHLIDEVLGEG